MNCNIDIISEVLSDIKEKYSFQTTKGARWPYWQSPEISQRGKEIRISVPASLCRSAGYIVLGDMTTAGGVDYKGMKLVPKPDRSLDEPNIQQLCSFADDLIDQIGA